ncbi:MAG: DUF6208 family protein [Kangiellaceae bacterium]|nr:DUF6208 family protein [Kangiellaceae bacterium]
MTRPGKGYPILVWFSLLLHRLMRFVLRGLLNRKLKRELQASGLPSWRGYGELLTSRPLFFHYVMVNAPRWNCHATIGVLSALRVKRQISIDLAQADAAASAWTIVVYQIDDGMRTVTYLNRQDFARDAGTLDLSPGLYGLGVRYYEPAPDAHWPAVRVDGQAIAARRLDEEPTRYQAFLQKLQQRSPWFYRFLHYHAFVMAREPERFKPEQVREVLLPVGNPATTFAFGHLPAGSRLQVQLPPAFLAENLVYVTQLSRASLPQAWSRIEATQFETAPLAQASMYLVRSQSKSGADLALPSDAIKVE